MRKRSCLPESIRNLALELFHTGAFLDRRSSPDGRGWKLKLHEEQPDAPLSPYKLNLRTPEHPTDPGNLTPAHLSAIGQELFDLAERQHFLYDFITGIPDTGSPLARGAYAAAVRAGKNKGLVTLKKEWLDDKRRITGVASVEGRDFYPGAPVFIVDDVITGAESKLEAIQILEEDRFRIGGIGIFLDREQGGLPRLRNVGFGNDAAAVLTITRLLSLYHANNLIPVSIFWDIHDYVEKKKRSSV